MAYWKEIPLIFTIVCVLGFLVLMYLEGIFASQIYARLALQDSKITFEDIKSAIKSGNKYSELISSEEYKKMAFFKRIRIFLILLFLISFIFEN
ncbi:hypothetical protein D172_011385 [Pseudoalteromonas sp. Bsw20308]|nr:hypothetical protein D172_011385 [Pseudoalteromonas sp. Bsw20308]